MKSCPTCGSELAPFQVYDLQQECWGCPSSWRGRTTAGHEVYIRYRWGHLRLEVDGNMVRNVNVGDGFDGIMSEDEMVGHLGIEVMSRLPEATT